MKYTTNIQFSELRKKYDYIIGFADEFVEFEQRFSILMYNLDYFISDKIRHDNNIVCNYKIIPYIDFISKKLIKDIDDAKICIILFSNREVYIIPELIKYFTHADFIVSRLVISESIRPHSYSRDYEDLFIMNIINKIDIHKDFSYVDIGVCHPVVRNNTFLLYENGFYNGILVEPNPDFDDLINEYRPRNTFINAGVGANSGRFAYIQHINGLRPGWNYFLLDDSDIDSNIYKKTYIDLIDINRIFSKIYHPFGVLDLDAEKMDLSILQSIDFNRFSFAVVCVEPGKGGRLNLSAMMSTMYHNGYIHITNTLENAIFIKKEFVNKLG